MSETKLTKEAEALNKIFFDKFARNSKFKRQAKLVEKELAKNSDFKIVPKLFNLPEIEF